MKPMKVIRCCLVSVMVILLVASVQGAQKDVVAVTMNSPTSSVSIDIDEYFGISCTAQLSGGGKTPTVTYAGQYCDESDCSGGATTITMNDNGEIITLESGATNPESMSASSTWSYDIYGKNGGTVYVRCKVAGGSTCSGGCYSATEEVTVNAVSPSTVAVVTYDDFSYSNAMKLFDRGDTIFTEATVTNDDSSDCTDCNVTATYIISGSSEKTLSLSHVGSGVYRNSWITNNTTTNGIYLVNVTATNEVGSAVDSNDLHIYSGSNVAAYSLDIDGDSVEEDIMENKHLIIAYGSTQFIEFLLNKDEDVEFAFTSFGDRAADGQGEITAAAGYKVSSVSLKTTGESLSDAIAEAEFEIGTSFDEKGRIDGTEMFEDEEIIIATKDNIYVYEWNSTSETYYQVASTSSIFSSSIREVDVGQVIDEDSVQIVVTGYDASGIAKVYNYSDGSISYIATISPSISAYGLGIGNLNTSTAIEEILIDAQSSASYAEVFTYVGSSFVNTYDINRPLGTNGNFFTFIENVDLDSGDEAGLVMDSGATYNSGLAIFQPDTYLNTVNYTLDSTGQVLDEGRFADIDGDGSLEIFTVGSRGRVIIADYTGTTIFNKKVMNISSSQAIAVGDFNNDACWDFAAGEGGTVTHQTIVVYEGDCTGNFIDRQNITIQMQSDGDRVAVVMDAMDATDIDGDGYYEFYMYGYDIIDDESKVWVYRYNDLNPNEPYYNSHNITVYTSSVSGKLEAYDLDLDSVSTGGTDTVMAEIKLGSEDADYVRYTVFNSTLNTTFYAPLSGVLGSSGNDDRYHLENGSDGLMSSLGTQWNDFAGSDYVSIYDDSISSDTVNDSVIALVSFNETDQVSYQDVGLYGTSACRIHYDAASGTVSDSVEFLLAFTAGNYGVIDQWMSSISSGALPDPNFMAEAGCTEGDNRSCPLQQGVCAGSNETCTGGSWSGCDYGVDYASTETSCDNKDNDCDGLTDESLTQQCGDSDVGACEYGLETCSAGSWVNCTGAVYPTNETCNDADDDCDTEIDEDFTNETCQYLCEPTYVWSGNGGSLNCCGNDANEDNPYESVEQSCDSNDNDCDGQIDYNLTQDCGPNNETGICEFGTETCSGGSWGSCIGAVYPDTENCINSLDDDCDGYTDGDDPDCVSFSTCEEYCQEESYPTGDCKKNEGACNKAGQTWESGGDQYCPGDPNHDTCCCGTASRRR